MAFSDIRLRTRLMVGFSAAIVALVAAVLVATWRFSALHSVVDKMVNQTMAKERLVATWAAGTNLNGARTFMLLEMDDEHRLSEVRQRIKNTSAEISAIQKQLDAFETAGEEQSLLAEIATARTAYTTMRDAIFKERPAHPEAARVQAWQELEPVLNAYVAAISKLTAHQAVAIGAMREDTANLAESSQRLLTTLGAGATLACLLIAAYIIRGTLRQLGGEPADVKRIANRIAQGDLSVAIRTAPHDNSSVMYAVKQMQLSFARIVTQVRRGADVLAGSSAEIAAGNMDLSVRTEAQAAALEQTAASMEQQTSTVHHNAAHTENASQLAGQASAVAEQGGVQMADAVRVMGAINDSARRIVDIIAAIDGIAFQTNILALNAAVEAARAGEQGRGFAVVAAEVRALAQRSAVAAGEIKGLIDDSVANADTGSRLVEQAGGTMREVVAQIGQVRDVIRELSLASREQATGVDQVNRAVLQMDAATQQNAALVEEMAAASEALREQAAQLSQAVQVFQLEEAPTATSRLALPGNDKLSPA